MGPLGYQAHECQSWECTSHVTHWLQYFLKWDLSAHASGYEKALKCSHNSTEVWLFSTVKQPPAPPCKVNTIQPGTIPTLGNWHDSVGSSPHLTPPTTPSHHRVFQQLPEPLPAVIQPGTVSRHIYSLYLAVLYHFGHVKPETPKSSAVPYMTLNP